MRASTLFAVIISLLIGCGVVVGAKYLGLFDKKADTPEARSETPREAPIKVLVAGVNLYKDMAVTADQVTIRELRADEKEKYAELKNQKDADGNPVLLPALSSAAHLRIPNINIPADQILTSKILAEHSIPLVIPKDMAVNDRLINVAVLKQNAAGGTIRMGDTVDVWLTSNIGMRWEGEMQRTAVIARGVKVRLKRNSIWPRIQADPDNQPINFTLQTNAYRSALIQFATSKGIITLAPSSSQMEMMSMMDKDKIELFVSGTKSISDADLLEAFGLKAPTPPESNITTRMVIGTAFRGQSSFAPTTPPPLGPTFEFVQPGKHTNLGRFQPISTGAPQAYDPNDPDCPTCKKPPQPVQKK